MDQCVRTEQNDQSRYAGVRESLKSSGHRGALLKFSLFNNADAYAAFDRFVTIHAAKYPKATDTLKKDRESLHAFYDFPAEHWQHLRTTNAIESTFATVRHRTTRTRNCVSRPTFLGLAFKLIEEAEKTWRRINGPEQIKLLLEGVAFKDGEPVQDDRPDQQKLAV
jgi:putative transposase